LFEKTVADLVMLGTDNRAIALLQRTTRSDTFTLILKRHTSVNVFVEIYDISGTDHALE